MKRLQCNDATVKKNGIVVFSNAEVLNRCPRKNPNHEKIPLKLPELSSQSFLRVT